MTSLKPLIGANNEELSNDKREKEDLLSSTIATLEEESSRFLKRAGLTEAFFCEYDPDVDYVLTFEPKEPRQAGDALEPRCVKLSLDEASKTRQKFIDERFAFIARLTDVHARIDKFEVMLYDYLKMKTDKRNLFNAALEQADNAWRTHLINMQTYLVNLEAKLKECSEQIYSKHQNTLLQIKATMCEPLSEVVDSIERTFYPRMFYMEDIFGQAKQNVGSGTWTELFAKTATKVVSFIVKLLTSLKGVLRTVTSYIYTYGLPALKLFGNAIGTRVYQNMQQIACNISRPDILFAFYTSLYKLLKTLAIRNAKFVGIVRDKIRVFCNPLEQRLVPFLENTVQGLITEYGHVEPSQKMDNNLKTDIIDYANVIWDNQEPMVQSSETKQTQEQVRNVAYEFLQRYDTEVQRKPKSSTMLTSNFCTAIKILSRDVFGNDRTIFLLWMICVTSMETIRKIIMSSAETCSAIPAKKQQKQQKQQAKGQSTDPKTVMTKLIKKPEEQTIEEQQINDDAVLQSIYYHGDVVTDIETNNEIDADVTITPFKDIFNAAPNDNVRDSIFVDAYTESKIIYDIVSGVSKKVITQRNDIDQFISGLFSFFWYFAHHNFLSTKDVENGTAVKYGDEQAKLRAAQELTNAAISNPQIGHAVPNYVRYAYCRAQNNDPRECVDLVENKKPIHALADGEERYAYYLQLAKKHAEATALENQASLLQSPEETTDMINRLLREAGAKSKQNTQKTQNEKTDMAKRLEFLQKQSNIYAQQQQQQVTTSTQTPVVTQQPVETKAVPTTAQQEIKPTTTTQITQKPITITAQENPVLKPDVKPTQKPVTEPIKTEQTTTTVQKPLLPNTAPTQRAISSRYKAFNLSSLLK